MFDQNGGYVPQWQNMGDDEETPDAGPFAAALKKKFSQPPAGQTGMPHEGMTGEAPVHEGMSGAGGPKSF